MIFRNVTKQYVTMSSHHLNDVNLSLKAKGLLAQMLLLAQHDCYDHLSTEHLVQLNPNGKAAVRSALRELENAGYITRYQQRDASGRFLSTEYIVYEIPQHSRV